MALTRIMGMMGAGSAYRDSWVKKNQPIEKFEGVTLNEAGRIEGLDLNHADIQGEMGELGMLLGELSVKVRGRRAGYGRVTD